MLTAEQYRALLDIAPQVHRQFGLFLTLAHETGHRAASIRQLRWSDVDLERKRVTWRGESDKIGFTHETPLTDTAAAALAAERAAHPAIGDAWIFPAPRDATLPANRDTLNKWWARAEELAGIPRTPGLGYHSLRRKFATEMKHAPLRDLSYLGGWKSPQTVLTCYQQPDEDTQRDALATRRETRSEAILGAR